MPQVVASGTPIELPFEFIVEGPPVSLQTRNRSALMNWRDKLKLAALTELRPPCTATSESVEVQITHYCEQDSPVLANPDVDNLIKPIQDALKGIVYVDDRQVEGTRCRRRDLNGSYRVRGLSPQLARGFSGAKEFLHIKVSRWEDTGDLRT